MIRTGIEPRSLGTLVNTLTIVSMCNRLFDVLYLNYLKSKNTNFEKVFKNIQLVQSKLQ